MEFWASWDKGFISADHNIHTNITILSECTHLCKHHLFVYKESFVYTSVLVLISEIKIPIARIVLSSLAKNNYMYVHLKISVKNSFNSQCWRH